MHGSCTEVLHSSYTMGTRGSPDIYTLSPRACGPRALGVYIRQTTRAHGITIKNNILLLITRSRLSISQDSSSFKHLNMHTFTYATPTFIIEVLCLVTQVQLLLMAVTVN